MSDLSVQTVLVVPVTDHDALDEAFQLARRQLPALLPSSLPCQVVIKPNLCDIASWETGVTTDPRWLRILADQIRTIRPDAQIRCVESDAVSAYRSFRSCDETFERLGYVEAAREACVELVNLSRADSIDITLAGIPYPVPIPRLFLEELYLISVANLKVHPHAGMTGILKNAFGLLMASDRSPFHPYLSVLLSHFFKLFTPDLCIIDGRIGLEGKGPIIGEPVRMDTLIVGTDGLAVDEVACWLMGITPGDIPHLSKTAKALGRQFNKVRVLGQVSPRPFAIDPQRERSTIRAKFASQRITKRLEVFSNRWIDRAMRLRKGPVAFSKKVLSKIVAGRHAS